ncbi:prephenate dehydrogenase [Agrococcus casei]|uniref:Prephenate dehydrogenase n=1 Tax=Agrococcus casei LMG 22410 TaxID=1255656 RepID=A0A1R4GJW9_9MICO|nr:prephenate dehydrogenase [Agrococcus casei]SJM68459.1 Arogenate dehydrogenase [Agrococcus casei LMG 22410]
MPHRLQGPVRIVGTGLLGTSIGLGLTARGVDVQLADASPSQAALAADYGAGRLATADDATPQLIVVAVPPDVTAEVVASELARFPQAIVTDVASVKQLPLTQLRELGADVSRYLGSHPMAGKEQSGALAGTGDLFFGRPWVIASHDDISYSSGSLIDDLILDLGAVPIEMSVVEHDRAVALVSHVPQLASTLVASLLQEAPFESLRLAGGGLRDVTRVAGSDPALWMQILSANAEAVTEVLKQLRDSLDGVIEALDTAGEPGSLRAIAGALVEGNQGVARLPGKHGTHTKFARTLVRVDDRPGQLARLFTDIGDAGVNLEDVRIEHAEGAQFGVAEVLVALDAELELEAALTELGWKVLG